MSDADIPKTRARKPAAKTSAQKKTPAKKSPAKRAPATAKAKSVAPAEAPALAAEEARVAPPSVVEAELARVVPDPSVLIVPPAPRLDAAALKARSRRNLAIAVVLAAFVILVFIATLVNLSGGAVPHP